MADLWLAVCSIWEATYGKRCDSTLYTVSLVYKHSYWRSYLPYIVRCACNRASLKARVLSSYWSIAILCLQSQKSFVFCRRTVFVTPEPRLCFPGEFGESLPRLPSTSLPAPVIWNWVPWEAQTASQDGKCSAHRTVSSVWNGGWTCLNKLRQW